MSKAENSSFVVDVHSDLFLLSLKECGRSVPNTIIQFGEARSGSTLQFTTLCLLMLLLHEDEAMSVGCFFNTGQVSKYRVIKVHNFSFVEEIAPSDTWIFMTVVDKKHQELRLKVEHENLTIKNIVDLDEVGRMGFYIANRYQSLFGLSDEKMLHILEFLRYWDILRVCCGQQMSRDWRNKLAPQKDYIENHDPHSLAYHACEMFNISQVEQLFIKTYIFKKFSRIALMRDFIGKPSTEDEILDGNYCELCNKNIVKHNLQHNVKCV